MAVETTENVVSNKQLVHGMCSQDGGLVSPIDLTLDNVKPLRLEPLRWFHFDNPPFRMRITNSGDTMVVSGKWAPERPYLAGGPLDGNYVFSQIHFHWGSSEHEGSEHTVRGICYPMEMHVVFFKTRYLTQSAALKQNDGVIILSFLFKLQSRSAPGLHWLAGQLDSVTEPHTSTVVPPMPLSSLMVPFTEDYITYWGALTSQSCSHPVMWLVSRAALAISSDDLNLFRQMVNSKRENMTKNFRATSPAAGRSIFHINPSSEVNNLLLPGAVDPPCHAVVVSANYAFPPPVCQTDAKKIFSKGDSNDLEAKESLGSKHQKEKSSKCKTHYGHEETPTKITTEIGKGTNNKNNPDFTNTKVSNRGKSPSPLLEKNIKAKPKLQNQCVSKTPPSPKSGRKINNSGPLEQNGDCVHINATHVNVNLDKSSKDKTTDTKKENDLKKVNGNKNCDGKQSQKSKLPVPKTRNRRGRKGSELESCYASYFQRPESAPTEPVNAQSTSQPAPPHTKSKPVTPASESGSKRKTTTIPRPSTRQGVK